MTYEFREYPDWSWSQTRRNYFDKCHKMYYFYYYLAHNGWYFDGAPLSKAAYRLKQMYDITMFLGDSIHYHIEQHLSDMRYGFGASTKIDMYNNVKNQIVEANNNSKNRKEEWEKKPKAFRMLQEIYYDDSLGSEKLNATKKRLKACVQNFFESKTYKEISETEGKSIVECENLNYIMLDGTKVFVKMDVLYKKDDDNWVIVDWKTGKPSPKYDSQILLYMTYVHEKYEVPFENIEVRLEYLADGTCTTLSYDAEAIDKVKEDAIESINEMKLYLADVEKNVAKSQEHFEANPSPKKCASCNFRGICKDKILN